MKLTIEINDEALRNAVDSQVQKAIAAIADGAIQAEADRIVKLKLERFDYDAAVTRIAGQKINASVDRALGSEWNRQTVVRDLLRDAAVKLLKESAK